MSKSSVARETRRAQRGSYVERTFGPASPQTRIVFRFLRAVVYPFVASWRPTRRGIRFLRWFYGAVIQVPPIRDTTIVRRTLGGIPVEWTTTPRSADAGARQRVILYVHGGGYVFGSPRTHRNLVSRLSYATATPVANVDYRMPPETSLHGSREDVFAAYQGLLDSGYESEAIIVCGDSAGGGLAAQLTLMALERGVPTPAGLILLSPWTDLTVPGDSFRTNSRYDFLIVKSILNRIAAAIVPSAEAREDWRNSPAFAPMELLAQFPPTLVQVGSRETLRDDGLAFARRVGDAGARVESQTYAGQQHVVAMWSGTAEARRAIKEIYRWLEIVLPDERDPKAPTQADLDTVDAAGPGQLPGPEISLA